MKTKIFLTVNVVTRRNLQLEIEGEITHLAQLENLSLERLLKENNIYPIQDVFIVDFQIEKGSA